MKTIPYFEVFALTGRMFGGNPAGVCLLKEWLPNDQLQAIAAQNDLPETAFLVRQKDGFELRWMTPTVEVELCGHATLASAHVLFRHLGYSGETVLFRRKAGAERRRAGNRLVLDFPRARRKKSRLTKH